MENIIRSMINDAHKYRDYELADHVYNLMEKFAVTSNCPENWRCIGEQMSAEFQGNEW